MALLDHGGGWYDQDPIPFADYASRTPFRIEPMARRRSMHQMGAKAT